MHWCILHTERCFTGLSLEMCRQRAVGIYLEPCIQNSTCIFTKCEIFMWIRFCVSNWPTNITKFRTPRTLLAIRYIYTHVCYANSRSSPNKDLYLVKHSSCVWERQWPWCVCDERGLDHWPCVVTLITSSITFSNIAMPMVFNFHTLWLYSRAIVLLSWYWSMD